MEHTEPRDLVDRYKCVGALMVFIHSTFTIEDLIQFTDLPRNFISSCLKQYSYFIKTEAEKTSRHSQRYSIKQEKIIELQNMVRKIYSQIIIKYPPLEIDQKYLLSLLAAEDVMTRKFKEVTDAEKQKNLLETLTIMANMALHKFRELNARIESLQSSLYIRNQTLKDFLKTHRKDQ